MEDHNSKQSGVVVVISRLSTREIVLSELAVSVLAVFIVTLLSGKHASMDIGMRLFGWFMLVSLFVQSLRFPLLRSLLSDLHWGSRKYITELASCLYAFVSSMLIAVPLVNLHIYSSPNGSYVSFLQAEGVLPGMLFLIDHEFGIPDLLAAIAIALLLDVFILWTGALFAKAAFKSSLRAALIMNAAIYIPVTLLFLMPYFAHKIGR
jgi:hypothetical protein